MVVMELGQYNALIARIEELVTQNAQLISAIPPEQLEFLNQPLVILERVPMEEVAAEGLAADRAAYSAQ